MSQPDLSPIDKELFWTLANDPADRANLLERAARHENLKEKHPMVKEHLQFQDRVNSTLGEWKSKVEDLEKRLKERESNDLYHRQRESLRKAPYNFNDEKISKLEARLKEDKDLPGFPEIDSKGKTYYQHLADYIRMQDSPVPASTVNLDMPGLPHSNEDLPWRKALESQNKDENPMLMTRKARKAYTRKLWDEAVRDEQERMGAR